jgi:hypothetical protein
VEQKCIDAFGVVDEWVVGTSLIPSLAAPDFLSKLYDIPGKFLLDVFRRVILAQQVAQRLFVRPGENRIQ